MQRWPERLWIVRHGESAGNVARDAAHAAGLSRIDIAHRDVDVPLSSLGEEQSRALGRWFAALPAGERPNVVLTSPYLRAQRTAEIIEAEGGVCVERHTFVVDERLREKEFGVLDRLTRSGIEELHPDQAEFRRLLGKFYHRPPGGESWCDVALRVRSLFTTWQQELTGTRVAVFSHQAVIMCARMVIEQLGERELLDIDRGEPLVNCSMTTYESDRGALVLRRANDPSAVDRQDEPVTKEPGAQVAADVTP
jgi:2,3-bisphosphoglycerate-dependent phosphoglycerate mutase